MLRTKGWSHKHSHWQNQTAVPPVLDVIYLFLGIEGLPPLKGDYMDEMWKYQILRDTCHFAKGNKETYIFFFRMAHRSLHRGETLLDQKRGGQSLFSVYDASKKYTSSISMSSLDRIYLKLILQILGGQSQWLANRKYRASSTQQTWTKEKHSFPFL